MMRSLTERFGPLLQLCAAAGISFVFFVLISLLHNLFGAPFSTGAATPEQHRIIAEIVKPPPPREEKRAVERMRSVRQPSSQGIGGQASSAIARFTPDLGIETQGGAGIAVAGQELAAEVFEEGQTDENAAPLFQTTVPYPDRARELGVQGTLEVVFIVDTDGRVSSIDIVKSPHPSISAAARKTIAQWRFKPAKNKGVPVKMRMRQVIDFALD
jgi:protein TonB